ncbi:MAG: right-handed parallel beta-helix repeat-containing protein [Verrucomicrobiales bacterium]
MAGSKSRWSRAGWMVNRKWPCLTGAALSVFLSSARAATLNVTAYGAVANDARDDRAAIQGAINAAAAGDTVLFPAGTFRLSGAIQPKSGIRLEGAAAGGSVLLYVGGALSEIIGIGGLTNVTVTSLTLDGNGSTAVKDGILASYSNGLRLENLIIRNFGNAPEGPRGIRFDPNVNDSIIAGNRIENIGTGTAWGVGIRLSWGSSRNQVTDNVIANTGRGGIFCNDDSSDNAILRNTVTGSGGEGLGIEVWGRSLRSLIEDNRIDHWLSVCCGSDFTAVRRNTVSDKSGLYKLAGLEYVDSRNVVFTDNLVDGGAQIGISISGEGVKENALWLRNTIQRCGSLGAQLMGQSGGCRYQYFHQNKFLTANGTQPPALYPNMGDGFRFNYFCNYISLEENQMSNNAHDGIVSFGGNEHTVNQISFTNNTITGNGNGGVWDGFGGDLEWSGNTVAGNLGGGGGAAWNAQLASRGFANQKPVASFTAPSAVLPGQAVTFTNTSTDPDGSIGRVLWDFGSGLPSDTMSPTFTFRTAGTYAVTLVVWDIPGRASRVTKTITVGGGMVPSGSVWKYHESGSAPQGWATNTFDDTSWPAGPGILGFGDLNGQVPVTQVNAAPARITTYFRHAFNVSNPRQFGDVTMQLLREDGAVIWLNGVEVHRSNMIAAPAVISGGTPALASVPAAEENAWFATVLDARRLRSGQNVIAAEVHNITTGSSDLGFDLSLGAAADVAISLIAAGATWKYRDTGISPPSNWTSPAYSDTAWSSGPARLGYGDTQATTIQGGPETSRYITSWFRHTFTVADSSQFDALRLELQRDDGLAVYLNGVELLRDNLPASVLTASTLASVAIGGADETAWNAFTLPAAALVTGTNTLAIEVHQNAATSSDLGLDVRLFGLRQASSTFPAWQANQFGSDASNAAISGPLSDFEKDGTVTLLEYAFAGDPRTGNQDGLPIVTAASGRLALHFERNTLATDITLTVQAADTTAGPWTDLASSTAGNPFIPILNGTIILESPAGSRRSVEVRDLHPVNDPLRPSRFMRVKVSSP